MINCLHGRWVIFFWNIFEGWSSDVMSAATWNLQHPWICRHCLFLQMVPTHPICQYSLHAYTRFHMWKSIRGVSYSVFVNSHMITARQGKYFCHSACTLHVQSWVRSRCGLADPSWQLQLSLLSNYCLNISILHGNSNTEHFVNVYLCVKTYLTDLVKTAYISTYSSYPKAV